MSNNINDTKVNKIREQVKNLLEDLNNGDNKELLEQKYEYLYSTSKTLFEFIIRETAKKNFNKSQFDTNLDFMLNHILKIQNKELSQNDASENVGKLVAKQFIPQYK